MVIASLIHVSSRYSLEPRDRHEGKKSKNLWHTHESKSGRLSEEKKKRGDEAKVSPTQPDDSTLRESCLLRLHWRVSAESSHRHLSGSSDDLVRLLCGARRRRNPEFSRLFFPADILATHRENFTQKKKEERKTENCKIQLTSKPSDLAQTPPSWPAMHALETHCDAINWLST